jgi:MscS family membrane protein
MSQQQTASISEFWELVVSVWEQGFMGVDVGKILTAFFIFLIFLILRGLFTRIVVQQIVFWSSRTKNQIDDHLVEALKPPIRFIPIVLGFFFASHHLNFGAADASLVNSFVDGANRTLIAFTLFWALHRLVTPLGQGIKNIGGAFSEAMVDWSVKALKLFVILLGGATILEIWGIEVMPLIAGLGLFGVAVALGAQDLFKNLIAGLFVIGERRFHKGDWIKVENVIEGTVEQIGFRTTKIRRFDKAPVYVPNSVLSDNAVTNFSEMTYRRIKWHIALEYSTSVDQLRIVRGKIEKHILENKDFASPQEASTFVRVDRFSDSSIDILLYCFTKTTDWGEWLEIKESLASTLKTIVEGEGVGFAFPTRSIYIESSEKSEKPEPDNQVTNTQKDKP